MLLERAAELVAVPSVSHEEGRLADLVEAELRVSSWLTVDRVGNTVVARTSMGRPQRLLLAGHLDTVPANGNEAARLEGDRLYGLGAADMKGGLAVLLELARSVEAPEVDVTYVFYECEEVAQRHNGLRMLAESRPELLEADAAVLAEPTGAVVEAGCQGTLRVEVTVTGTRAHTARPWTGRNAIHRLGRVLARVEAYQGRRPVLDGCEFREALQAVRVTGGVAGNVVPDTATVELNHRFAPDRNEEEALTQVTEALGDTVDVAAGDTIVLIDSALPASPSLGHPVLAALLESTAQLPRAKLGWTDVAFFAARGVPATNFGPGDPLLAHTAGEFVTAAELDAAFAALAALLRA